MGTNRCLARAREVKSTIGPVRTSYHATEALSFKDSPNADAMYSKKFPIRHIGQGICWQTVSAAGSHVEQGADTHKYEACNQSVAEGQGVDRLQEVYLHGIHQVVRIRKHRVQKEIPQCTVGHERVPQLMATIPSPMGIMTIGSSTPFHPRYMSSRPRAIKNTRAEESSQPLSIIVPNPWNKVAKSIFSMISLCFWCRCSF